MKSLHLDVSEATANTVVGIAVSIATTLWVFPLMGIPTTLHAALGITAFYFVTSTVRSFLLRRLFRWLESPRHDFLLRLRATLRLIRGVPTTCWMHPAAYGIWTQPRAYLPFVLRTMRSALRYLWTCDMDAAPFGVSNREVYRSYVQR